MARGFTKKAPTDKKSRPVKSAEEKAAAKLAKSAAQAGKHRKRDRVQTRSVKTEVFLSGEAAAKIRPLFPLARGVKQDAATYAWEHPRVKSPQDLHNAVYDDLKAAYPTLPSQFICASQRLAMGSVQALRTAEKNGRKVNAPVYKYDDIPYDVRTMTLAHNFKSVSLSTIEKGKKGRVVGRLREHKQLKRYRNCECTTATLTEDRDGRFWLIFAFTKPRPKQPTAETFDPATSNIVGGDRGIVEPFALSTGKILGDPAWHSTDRRYLKTQRELQSKDTRSSKRLAKKRSGKWSRFRTWVDHNLTIAILTFLKAGTLLVLEDLSGITDRSRRFKREMRRRMHAWSFRRQQEMLIYKSHEFGVYVVFVDPRYTSQRCSACGHTAKNNRRSRSRFKCRRCNHAEHADLNAAKNIAHRGRDAANWIPTQANGNPLVAARKSPVSPPYAAHARARTPKTGRGDARASVAAKGAPAPESSVIS